MAWTPSSPLTGAPQTGLTSPTYTLSADTAPSSNGKQFAITALGGTQTGVLATTASQPFTLTFFKPAVIKQKTQDFQGYTMTAPMNVYKQITRKSVKVDTWGSLRTMLVTTIIEVPAGAEASDAVSVRAAMSCHIGALDNTSAGIGDTLVSGVY